jgi:hypothetical protein
VAPSTSSGFAPGCSGLAWRSTRSNCAMAARPAIEFQVIGEPDDDPLELLGKLIGKMRRALALTHLEDTDHRPQVNDRLILRGTVDSDPDEDHRVPMVVIDGREISWDELGRMVAAFEGWQFKLEFRDRSEEV